MILRYSLKSELVLWISKDYSDRNISARNVTVKDSGVVAYIRFGGLPTIDNYYDFFQIPQYPDALALSDDSPSDQGTFYIGQISLLLS